MKKLTVLAFVLYTLVIFLPPIIYKYQTPNGGTDAYWHIQRIIDISHGKIPDSTFYFGDYIIAYPLIWLKSIVPISVSYMWFNFVMLWFVGISCYLLMKELFTPILALLALPFTLTSQPLLNLYDTGAIFNLVTIGVLVPCILMWLVKIWKGHKKGIVLLLVLLALALGIHSIGIFRLLPRHIGDVEPPASLNDLIWLAGRVCVALFLVSLSFITILWHRTRIDRYQSLVLALSSFIVVASAGIAVAGWTAFSTRFAINFAIMFTILSMLVAAICTQSIRSKYIKPVFPLAYILISLPIPLKYLGVI